MFRTRSQLTPIGLDLGERSVRAVQLRLDRRARTALPAAMTRLRSPMSGGDSGALTDRHAAQIVDALDRQGFSGDRVVLALPQKLLLSGVLEVPPRASGAPLDVICRNELARVHRLEPEQIEAAWWELPAGPTPSRDPDGGGVQAVAVGCRQTDAEVLITAFESVGVEVVAIDARGPALVRAAAAVTPQPPALGAVLEWDAEAAHIVLCRGGVILYERYLVESGLTACRAEAARKLAIDSDIAGHLTERIGLGEIPAEFADEAELVDQARRLLGERLDALAVEIRASMAYAARRFGDSVATVLVCGDGSHIPGARERLEHRVEQPLTLALPRTVLPGADDPAHTPCPASLLAAIGLAMHPEGGEAWSE